MRERMTCGVARSMFTLNQYAQCFLPVDEEAIVFRRPYRVTPGRTNAAVHITE